MRSIRALLFSARAKLDCAKGGNNKAHSHAKRGARLFLCEAPPGGSQEKRAIL